MYTWLARETTREKSQAWEIEKMSGLKHLILPGVFRAGSPVGLSEQQHMIQPPMLDREAIAYLHV